MRAEAVSHSVKSKCGYPVPGRATTHLCYDSLVREERLLKRFMIKILKSSRILLLMSVLAARALAGPIKYNINFDLSGGGPLPTGSFTYDSTAALGISIFQFYRDLGRRHV